MDEKLLKLSCIIDRKASDCELLQSRYDGLVDEDKKLEDKIAELNARKEQIAVEMQDIKPGLDTKEQELADLRDVYEHFMSLANPVEPKVEEPVVEEPITEEVKQEPARPFMQNILHL